MIRGSAPGLRRARIRPGAGLKKMAPVIQWRALMLSSLVHAAAGSAPVRPEGVH